jgi:hypothetical protein
MTIKNYLDDIVSHTYSLGVLEMVKLTPEEDTTKIDSISEDKSVILMGNTHLPINQIDDVVGLGNLDKLSIHLKCPVYKDNSSVSVIKETRNKKTIPTSILFKSDVDNFQNDYKLTHADIINEKIVSLKFKVNNWDISFNPSRTAIEKLKYQVQAHSSETTFNVKIENNDLIFEFGDGTSHTGSFAFEPNITGKLKHVHTWPIQQVQNILNLKGECEVKISDVGALQISITSELATYNYILPAVIK